MPSDARLLASAEVRPRDGVLARLGVRPLEALPWLLAIGFFLCFDRFLALGTSILVMTLFALSLDILVGYAGVISLGHAIFFGVGAYAAGLLATSGWTEPITGLLAGALVSAALATLLCLLGLSRLRGLLLIMTTLSLALIAHEAAKDMRWLTGGDDGLQGIEVAPIFGVFPWSVYGQTAYFYALAVLFVCFVALRQIVASPFGLAMRGVRENYGRMQLVGAPVNAHLLRAFAVSAFVAGAAGALSAQTGGFVDLNVFSLDTSTGVLVMLVLGGLGRLYGAFLGVAIFMIVQTAAAEIDPYDWMYVIGALLIVVVLFSRGGLLGALESGVRQLKARLV